MDKKEILKALQAQVAQIQQELDNEEAVPTVEYPAMLPNSGEFYLAEFDFCVCLTEIVNADCNQNVFPDEDTAEKYADAFKVMLELRRCDGAGHYSYGDGWAFTYDEYNTDGDITHYSRGNSDLFAFFPPFPSYELAEAAQNKVGKERIIASIKFLANIKD